ncbi:hypothetical protein HDV05_005112 [Chytridiales sp. JEL 0842]|nr:hypothetical protein HDV05_005112 [Chytridiales sp. JEL 0842]
MPGESRKNNPPPESPTWRAETTIAKVVVDFLTLVISPSALLKDEPKKKLEGEVETFAEDNSGNIAVNPRKPTKATAVKMKEACNVVQMLPNVRAVDEPLGIAVLQLGSHCDSLVVEELVQPDEDTWAVGVDLVVTKFTASTSLTIPSQIPLLIDLEAFEGSPRDTEEDSELE